MNPKDFADKFYTNLHPGGGQELARSTLAKEISTHFVLKDFARQLALALADEVAFAGEEAAVNSLALLARARDELELKEEFDRIDSLGPLTEEDKWLEFMETNGR